MTAACATAPADAPLAPLLELKKVVRRHITRQIVQHELHADLAFHKPEVVGLFGPNGSGKSTLMDLMAGRIDPTQGQVQVRGQHLNAIRREQRYKLVHHRRQPHLADPQAGRFEPLVLRPRELALLLREAFRNLLRKPAPEGGARVHLFDEPPLERPYGELMFERFRRMRSEGGLVLFAAHPSEPWHIERIGEVCDRYLFLKDGRLTQMHSFEVFMKHPDVVDYLSAMRATAS